MAIYEPVTYSVRKTIEGAVVEMIRAGEVKGLWHYAPKGFDAPDLNIEDMLPEGPIEIIEEEVYDDYKKKIELDEPEVVVEEVKETLVKIEEPLSDAIVCESGPHHYRCYEDEKTTTSTDTTATDR